EQKLADYQSQRLEPFLSKVRDLVEAKAEVILAYGSCLSDITKMETSVPDFYILISSYFQFHRSFLHAILNWILPPSIYHFKSRGQDAKFSVISLKDLSHETSPKAWDVYHLGRFSKRMALIWARSPRSRQAAIQAHASAMRSIAQKVYDMMPE